MLGLWDDPVDKPCRSQLLPVEALYFLRAGPVQQLRGDVESIKPALQLSYQNFLL